MKRREKVRLFIIFPMLVIIGLFLLIVAYILASKDKEYYIPEACIYIKIVKPPMSEYGYIYLSQNRISESSDLTDLDCIKAPRSDIATIDIFISPTKKKELYICPRYCDATLYPNKYEMAKIKFKNPAFYIDITKENRIAVKYPYFKIVIDGYLDLVYVAEHNERYLKSIKPIHESYYLKWFFCNLVKKW